jgi:hypothetical protein
MAVQEVTIYVDSTSPPTTPVSGVYVGLHNSSTKALLQTATTDAAGKVTFSNVESSTNSGVYELRVVPSFAASVAKGNVQNVTVLEAGNNVFDIQVTPEGLAVATNPRLCKCSGYFYDITGKPLKNLSLHIMEDGLPNIEYMGGAAIDTRVVVPKTRILKTDKNGFASVDMYREAKYQVLLEGYENTYRQVTVPDAASVNLSDLLFPTVASVEYYDAGVKLTPASSPTLSMASGAVKVLTCKVLLRSGVEAAVSEVTVSSADTAILTTSYTSGTLTLGGVAVGGPTSLVLKRQTSDIGGISIRPEPTILGVLSVTVT